MRTNTQKKQWEPTGDTFIDRCDDKDCRFDFHQYAIHSDVSSNRLLITDTDGNEEFETDSYLDCTTQPDVMRDYLQMVANTGDDYLGALNVTIKKSQMWTVTLKRWIGANTQGLIIASGRRKGHKTVRPADFPSAVAEFLEMKKLYTRYVTTAAKSIAELYQLAGDTFQVVPRGRNELSTRIRFTLDVPLTQTQNKRAVAAKARQALKDLNA